jgi:hypothetical protein
MPRRTRLLLILIAAAAAAFLVPHLLDRFYWPQLIITNADTQPIANIAITGFENNTPQTWHLGDLAPGQTRRISVHAGDVITLRLTYTCGPYHCEEDVSSSVTPLESLHVALDDPFRIAPDPGPPRGYRPVPFPTRDTTFQGPLPLAD